MRNIELKVKLNLKDIQAYLDTIKPSYIGRLKQKDTYFLLGNERLKIREENDKAELVYYVRENKAESRDSRYFILRLNKHFLGFIKNVLCLLLGVKKVVEKQRELYIYKNTRIHLDKVDRLGEFLELETMVKDDSKYGEYQLEQIKIISLLHLYNYQKVAFSYSDLEWSNGGR